ncbi:organic cation transporter protein-like [Mizuhopecten yessoensis]|uniref:organic cation transporter protein-like n=1 Tax=Mizuhopecten yessoensis TaxID=6573 RepID=UPI000B45E5E0|nr:organic cation transporter protein-like [Mizuhopecten yessoensis]
MHFDDILKVIGEFGPYQKRIYFLLCLPILFHSMFELRNAYIMYTPKQMCATIDSPVHLKETASNNSGDSSRYHDQYEYGECSVTIGNNSSNTTSYACSSWSYDKTVFTSTYVSEYNLVCDSALTAAYIQGIIHFGSLTGSFLEGFISDRFGRKRILCGSITLAMVVGTCAAFSPNIYVFTVLGYLQSLSCSFTYSSAFISGLELVGPSKRRWAGILINFFYSTGMILLSGIGYGFRDWKYIQIACSLPLGLFIVYWWIIPESPRWLISQGRYKEAHAIIRTIAKYNKCEDKLFLNQLTDDDDEEPERFKIWHLFSSWSIIVRCVIIWVNWIIISIIYFGFSLNAANLSGNFYLNHLLASLVEFPANAVAFVLLDRIGRKKLFILGMVIGGLCLLLTGVFEHFWPVEIICISFAMVGKFGITIGYAVVYVWSAELFPTGLRSTGLGLGCMFGDVGYIIAPYILQQALLVPGYGRILPLFLFAVLALGVSFLTLLLPETTMESLPETMQIHQERLQSYKSDRTICGDTLVVEEELL